MNISQNIIWGIFILMLTGMEDALANRVERVSKIQFMYNIVEIYFKIWKLQNIFWFFLLILSACCFKSRELLRDVPSNLYLTPSTNEIRGTFLSCLVSRRRFESHEFQNIFKYTQHHGMRQKKGEKAFTQNWIKVVGN